MGHNSSGKLFGGQVPQFFFKTVMTQQRHYSVDNVTLIHAPGNAAEPFCSKLSVVILKCVVIVRSFQNTAVNHVVCTKI